MVTTSSKALSWIGGALLLACGTAQPQTTIRIEAEDMQLDVMQVEAASFASNSALINLKGPGFVGSASIPFPGPNGNYDIVVVYHDENDGAAQLSVSIDSVTVDSWTLDQPIPDGKHATEANRLTRQVATGYTVNQGVVIKIDALQGNWDHANIDYIEFVGVGNPPTVVDFSKGEITIEEPGYYILDRDWKIALEGVEAVLEVAADDVTIDLRGFEIELLLADSMLISGERVTLKNGTLSHAQLSVTGMYSHLTGLQMNVFDGQSAISLRGDHARVDNSVLTSRTEGYGDESIPISVYASHATVRSNRISATGESISTHGEDVNFLYILENTLDCDGRDCLLIYGDHNVIARNTARQHSGNSFATIVGDYNHLLDNVSLHYASSGITGILIEGTQNILRGNILQTDPTDLPFRYGISFTHFDGNYYGDNLISAETLVNLSGTMQIDLGGNHGL